ncbi:OLC1v1025689C1 [Oldenlandia corymbosa var. corymbosa]|uniref:Auxin-responsive protein n=1 Tax=Oldenlandia corymbosa var. corymbosa TaxID=529605 RepID=A0AAV1C6T4_OLDCO|nr:OLC1v1025689C1 [Oldenlandia corymbosa var. corymbosa]
MARDDLGLNITELRLGLPGSSICQGLEKKGKKGLFPDIESGEKGSSSSDSKSPHKNEVVGWPPVWAPVVRTKSSISEQVLKMYVKVSMDGAPFLRKIDLTAQKGYSDLIAQLVKLFGSYGIDEGSLDYVVIYEDKEGDWMLMGDVPWSIFLESCKRLRIVRSSDRRIGIGELHTKS